MQAIAKEEEKSAGRVKRVLEVNLMFNHEEERRVRARHEESTIPTDGVALE